MVGLVGNGERIWDVREGLVKDPQVRWHLEGAGPPGGGDMPQRARNSNSNDTAQPGTALQMPSDSKASPDFCTTVLAFNSLRNPTACLRNISLQC